MDPEQSDDGASVDIVGPVRLTFDLDGLTQNEIDHIKNTVESFVEVVGGDIVILEGPQPQDGVEEQLTDDQDTANPEG